MRPETKQDLLNKKNQRSTYHSIGCARELMYRRASIPFLFSAKEITTAKNTTPVTVFAGTKSIGKMVLKRLKTIDKVAWMRFASVYFELNDIEGFDKLIEKIAD